MTSDDTRRSDTDSDVASGELSESELDGVSGGLEVNTDVVSKRIQQELYDAGSAHQAPFPRLTSRFGGSPSGT